jgi:seryl-tRNA(Sec) selenium transferase
MDLKQVETIEDLSNYLHNHPSPVVADILQRAIRFFSEECRKEDGKKDWKAIKERKRMGLGFQLRDDTIINAVVVQAIRNWTLFPGYGHNLGTSFLDAMTSNAYGGISNPREEVKKILDFLRNNS